MENYDLETSQIEKAIIKGAKYLIQSINVDNGIKFEDEGSLRSGVWVTAEALEFFLKTRTLPIVSYGQVLPMIEFLLNQQKEDGSWTILSQTKGRKDESSTISTGHCIYTLKLSLLEDFLPKELKSRIVSSVKLGESWLRSCCIDKTSFAFWGTKKIKSCDPNIDERSRIEYVFDTYYAIMGFYNPKSSIEDFEIDTILKRKSGNFFKMQAEWFVNHYNDVLLKNQDEDLSNIISTFCRFINVSEFFEYEILSEDIRLKIIEIINKISNPFATTKVIVDNSITKEQGLAYTNNTPFDVGMALLNYNSNADTLKLIIQTFLNKQDSINGYWVLNFNNAFKIKTWTTSEALLVLEKAVRSYRSITLNQQVSRNIEILKTKNTELDNERSKLKKIESYYLAENKKLRIILTIVIVFVVCLSFGFAIKISIYFSLPENKDNSLNGVFSNIIFPLYLTGISSIILFLWSLHRKNITINTKEQV